MKRQEVRDQLERVTTKEHNRRVQYVGKSCRCPDIAQDCVQEAYLLALIHSHKIREPEKLSAWLMTVALRMAKRQMKYRRYCILTAEVVQGEMMDEEHLLNKMILSSIVSRLDRQYPAYYAEILWMRYVQNARFEEIACELHMPCGTVRNAHYRIKKMLRREFDGLFSEKNSE